jgi:hypothetical protein
VATEEQSEQPKAEEIELSPEDDAILDRIWDRIGAEDTSDDEDADTAP